jgi:hypothetical protein
LLCFTFYATVACADDQATLNKIFADWDKRHAAIERIAYRTQGKITFFKDGIVDDRMPPPAVNPTFPKEDVEFLNNVNLSIDFKQSHFRVEESPRWYPNDELSFNRDDEWRLYDGQRATRVRAYVLSRREKVREKGGYPTEVDFNQRQIFDGFFTEVEFAIFPAHGILPYSGRIKPPAGLARMTPKESWTLQGDAEHKGRPVVTLKAVTETPETMMKTEDEICVDPEHDSAVVQWTRRCNGETHLQYQIDYQKTEGQWLPSHWTLEMWYDGKHVYRIELTVKEVKINPEFDATTFSFELTPGTVYVPADNPHHTFLKGNPGEDDKQLD